MSFIYEVSKNGYIVRCDDKLCVSAPVEGVFTSEENARSFWNKRSPITVGYHDVDEYYKD
jgi:hypothetical protein